MVGLGPKKPPSRKGTGKSSLLCSYALNFHCLVFVAMFASSVFNSCCAAQISWVALYANTRIAQERGGEYTKRLIAPAPACCIDGNIELDVIPIPHTIHISILGTEAPKDPEYLG